MPSMTRMRASAVRRSRIGAVAYRRDVKSVRGRRRGRRRRGRRRLGSRARQAVKEAKEAAVGAEHERGVVAVERRPVGLQRAVEGKELPILTERIGIDLDRLRVAVAAHPLTVALRLGEDNGAFALGGGAHRLRRADLPEENSEAIYARMKSERQQQAAQYRGEGAEAAQTLRATAERERTVVLAEAQRDGQRVRGDGDAQAVKIYADAFGQDRQFFAFYRSLQAYRAALNGHGTSCGLSPDSTFFRFFNGLAGTASEATPPSPPAPSPPASH